MIFDDNEIRKIISVLKSDNEIISDLIANKIETLRNTSKIKRYSLRTTDWLSESAKNRKKKINKKEGGLI